jgi:Uma2 family endonuclease
MSAAHSRPQKLQPTPPRVDHPPRITPKPPKFKLPNFDQLPAEDGVPLETPWHLDAMTLLIEVIRWLFTGRTDYFVGGNMFVYYSAEQAQTWKYRGPDFFYVANVAGRRKRRFWLPFEEGGRYPDVIVELGSPSTVKEDHGTKKDIYEGIFRTPDYFIYDPDKRLLEGWSLERSKYQPLSPNEHGWLWCAQLGLWLGTWEGEFRGQRDVWPRFYDKNGKLLLTGEEAQRHGPRQNSDGPRRPNRKSLASKLN